MRIVESLEMIDVDHQDAQGLGGLHRVDHRGSENVIERAAIRQAGKCVGLRLHLGFRKRQLHRLQLLRRLGEVPLECRCSSACLRQFGDERLDDQARIAVRRNLRGDAAESCDLYVVVGDSRSEERGGAVDDAIELLGRITCGQGRRPGVDERAMQFLVGRSVEPALVAEQNVYRLA